MAFTYEARLPQQLVSEEKLQSVPSKHRAHPRPLSRRSSYNPGWSPHVTTQHDRELVLRSWRHACGGSTCHEVLCRLQPCTLMLCAYSSVCRYRAAARCLGTWLATAMSWGCTDDDACLLWLHSSQCSDSSDAMVTNATSDGTGVSRLNHSAS